MCPKTNVPVSEVFFIFPSTDFGSAALAAPAIFLWAYHFGKEFKPACYKASVLQCTVILASPPLIDPMRLLYVRPVMRFFPTQEVPVWLPVSVFSILLAAPAPFF